MTDPIDFLKQVQQFPNSVFATRFDELLIVKGCGYNHQPKYYGIDEWNEGYFYKVLPNNKREAILLHNWKPRTNYENVRKVALALGVKALVCQEQIFTTKGVVKQLSGGREDFVLPVENKPLFAAYLPGGYSLQPFHELGPLHDAIQCFLSMWESNLIQEEDLNTGKPLTV